MVCRNEHRQMAKSAAYPTPLRTLSTVGLIAEAGRVRNVVDVDRFRGDTRDAIWSSIAQIERPHDTPGRCIRSRSRLR